MNINKTITLLIALLTLVSCRPGNEKSTSASVSVINGIKVVSLYGTWEEMGRQYGELAGENLRHVRNEFIENIIASDSAKAASIRGIAENLFSRYPYQFQKFFEGVSETSGLSVTQLKEANAVEYAEGCYCSGMAVWDDYAKDNLVYGRNYDAISFAPIARDLLVTVFHPSDGSLSVATIGYAGELYAVNAINEKGIFLELNNGMLSAGFFILFDRFAGTTSMLQALFSSSDLDYLDAFFRTNRSFASFIVGVADHNEARCYEWCADGTKRSDSLTPDGLMVMSNHYVHPDWTYPLPENDTVWWTLPRRNNLLMQAEQNKGIIDSGKMCELMSVSLEDGGTRNQYTRYQLVFEPQTMKLMVHVESAPEWTEIDMKEFL